MATVDASQFPAYRSAVDVDGVSSVPYITQGDAVGSLSVFRLHGKYTVFSFFQDFKSTFLVQGAVLSSDVFVIEFHKLRFSVSGSKDTTNTPICRMVRYRVGKNV